MFTCQEYDMKKNIREKLRGQNFFLIKNQQQANGNGEARIFS